MRELEDVISAIQSQEADKQAAAETIRDACGDVIFDGDGTVEDTLLHGVSPAELEAVSVVGIDGGLARQELHGVDMLFVRAVAAMFTYRGGSLEDCTYLPSKNPAPRMEYSAEVMERGEMDRLASLHRLREEIQLAAEVAEQDGLDLLLLDGSILPQYPDRPSEDSDLMEEYDQVMDAYVDLYEHTVENDILLAGVVEDTRSTNLCTLLQDTDLDMPVLDGCRDSHFLNYLLEKGERTLVMDYSHNEHHPILSDLSGHGDHIYSFYVKPVEHDRPVRIDLYAPDQPVTVAETVASQVCALSGAHAGYGIPSVLIEADQRAKMERHEIELRMKRLQAKLAHLSGVEDLRRNRRPF